MPGPPPASGTAGRAGPERAAVLVRILIAAVGRLSRGPERELFAAYASRIAAGIDLAEVEERRRLPAAERVEREGERLLARIPDGAFLVALDQRGRALSSEALARRLLNLRENGASCLAFAIGGADGLAPAVLDRANLVMSLGPMTWPHALVRVMLAEQLYRAEAILAGHPYHRAAPPLRRRG